MQYLKFLSEEEERKVVDLGRVSHIHLLREGQIRERERKRERERERERVREKRRGETER